MPTQTSLEFLYLASCALFLLGASYSYRSAACARAVAVMTAAVLLGAVVNFIPAGTAHVTRADLCAENRILMGSQLLDIAAVWLLFPAALILWAHRKIRAFHRLVFITEIGWCAAAMLMLYGLYWRPAL